MKPVFCTPRALAVTALAWAVASLVGCAAPPPPAASTPAPVAEPAQSAAPSESKPVQKVSKLADLRKELVALGLTVSDAPEGDLKIGIPTDPYFGLARTKVGPAFGKLLTGLADTLNKYPSAVIEIMAHTDSTKTDALNLTLTQKRAESIRDHLVEKKVAPDRIKAQGWGSDQPIAEDKTAPGRASNRRVEIFVSER